MAISAKEVMKLLDDDRLEALGSLYSVDKLNTKITGEYILKTYLTLILNGRSVSQRGIELATANNKDLSSLLRSKKEKNKKITHSAISKRLHSMEVGYIQEIYNDLVDTYNVKYGKRQANTLYKFDSTINNLSGYILRDGIKAGGKASDSQIKISVGVKHSIPNSVRFCSEQKESSEDVALIRAINEAKVDKEDILLFDRGISKACTYEDLNNKDYKFVTRVKVGRKHDIVKSNELTKESDIEGIISDQIVMLYGKQGHKPINNELRLIVLKNKAGEGIWFLTNLFETPAVSIAQMYKRRWDIEVFFKFIKQHLQFKTFVTHNMNGMKIYLLMVLIAAILFIIYKQLNNLTGYKIALLQFILELEKEKIRDLIILSGGNLELVKDRL